MGLEQLKVVSRVLSSYHTQLNYDAQRLIASGDFRALESYCTANGIQTELDGDNLILKLRSYVSTPLAYYEKLPQFFEASTVSSQFGIVNIYGEYCFHNAEGELIFSDNVTREFLIFCENLVWYYKIYNFLKYDDFADHHNDANQEIVIYNSAKGIFKIKYEIVPQISKTDNSTNLIKQLMQTASQIELSIFFKNALCTISQGKDFIFLSEIIGNAAEIISITKRNYALVSKQFDFDKFRDSLYTEKDKYFIGIREIVNKIFAQAIGVPISISAAVFATYKVADDSVMLLLVMTSFIIYVWFYIRIQLLYKTDLIELGNSFNLDFEIIKAKSGLESGIIETERVKIQDKIDKSIAMVTLFIEAVFGLGVLVSLYIVYELTILN